MSATETPGRRFEQLTAHKQNVTLYYADGTLVDPDATDVIVLTSFGIQPYKHYQNIAEVAVRLHEAFFGRQAVSTEGGLLEIPIHELMYGARYSVEIATRYRGRDSSIVCCVSSEGITEVKGIAPGAIVSKVPAIEQLAKRGPSGSRTIRFLGIKVAAALAAYVTD